MSLQMDYLSSVRRKKCCTADTFISCADHILASERNGSAPMYSAIGFLMLVNSANGEELTA